MGIKFFEKKKIIKIKIYFKKINNIFGSDNKNFGRF